MKRLVLVPSILLAKALFAVELLSPVGGVEVDLVPEVQRTVLALPTLAERIAFFAADRKAGGRTAKSKDWGWARPLVLTWRVAPGEKGPWKVRLGASRDWTGARIEVFEKAPRGGRVSCVFPQANLELGRRYFWQVSCAKGGGWSFEKEGAAEVGRAGVSSVAEFRTASEAPRWIELEGRARNIRDLGGRMGLGGRRVRQGLVFRGQGLNDNSPAPECRGRNRLTVEDVLYMTKDLGICTELDLRTPQETRLMEGSPLGPDVRRIVVDSEAYRGIFTSKGKKAMAECFRVFCDRKNYPIYFHCISGASRTGSLAYVLNGILGVSRQNLETDWELTYYPNIPDADPNPNRWNRESHFNDGFDRYGTADDTWNRRIELYLLSCGVTAEEIASFRDVMIEDGTKPVDRSRERNLQKQIDVTAAAGGGKIVVPAGEWETGPLHLKSNVELHLEEGAVLKFSDRIADYLPAVEVSWEGVECLNYSPLVYAYGATNVAITGKGTLAPRIEGWTPWFKREAPPQREAIRVLYKWSLGGTPLVERNLWKLDAHARPHLVHFNRCKGVRLEGFCIRESPFWCVHLYRSQDIVVRGLDISAMKQNNDGIDVEMSRNVMIENCHFNQGDDAIVLKAGRNREAYLTGEPTENVTIRNCTVDKALTFITIGSEMSGSVRHVRAQDCRAKVVDKIVHVKTNERRGGEVCDIDYRRIHCETARVAVVIQADAMYDEWKKIPSEDIALTAVHDIVLSDVTSGVVDFLGEIRGDARKPFGLILATGVRANHVRETQTWKIEHAPAFKEMVE